MADKFTAAESIRRLAKQYEDMVAAADALEAIGKLEQVTAEAGKQADAARADAEAAKAELSKVKEKIKADTIKAEGVAEQVKAAAINDALAVKLGAQEEAAHIVKKAQDEGAVIIERAATEKAKLSSEIGGLQRAIEAARSELAMLAQDKEAAEAATADAVKKLDAAKAKVKALFE